MADGDKMLLGGEDTREGYSDPMTDNFKSRIWLPRLIQVLDLLKYSTFRKPQHYSGLNQDGHVHMISLTKGDMSGTILPLFFCVTASEGYC